MSSRITHAFDTLAHAKRLKKAGFTTEQAEAQAEALADVFHDNLATKHDIKKLETRLFFRLSSMIIAVGVTVGNLLGGLIAITAR